MSTEVENQEQQKELSSSLGESIGEISSCWPQSMSTEGKMDTGDSGSVKSVGTPSSGVGSVPPFSKDGDKSSTESLGSAGIWGQKVGLQPESAWPGHGGIDWSTSNDGNKDGSKGYPWSSSAMQDGLGTTNALGLSLDFWKPNMLGGYGGSGGPNGWGESRGSGWTVPDSKTEFNKEGLPDKTIGATDQERSKGLWGGGPEERKVEPIGPVQRRSASLTELNVTFDSMSLGGESVKFPSTGKMGLNDERSQPDGAEVSQQNREELIMKMINSNEGWGKKPIIQETPWNMETVAVPMVTEPLPAATEDTSASKSSDSVFWNVPKESSSSGWNSAPAPAPTAAYEWAPDSDIGMWNGPPPPESVNPNMWTGPPKEPSPVWAGGQGGLAQVGADKGMLSSGTMGWSDNRGYHGSGMDKMQKEFGRDGGADRMRGSDSWSQQPPRGTFDNNWTSTEVNTWSLPHPADQHDNWTMKQPMNNFPSSGFGLGGKPEPISKIGTWGEANATETGLWNQQQPLSNIQNPLQQLMDLGLKKEDAIYLQNNMSADKLLELMRMKDNEQPKGRIIRGKSMVEMPSNDQFGHFQGNRNSGFQSGGRGAMYQSSAPGNIPPQMHMKGSGMQQSGGGGWPGMGASQVYNRTPSMPMGNAGLMQPVPQMNPMMHQTLLQLQSLLQPLLQQRAQIQQNRNITPMQKMLQVDQLNVQINEVKRHIDQVQLLFGPPPGTIAPNTMNSVPDQQLGGGFDEAKMMQQLLGLKQNRDFGGLSHPPLGPVSEMSMVDAKSSIGGMPNLSMDQMAALMGGSNRWLNPDQSPGFQLLGKDKLPSGDMLVDSLSNLGQSGGGSRMGWPGAPGDFGVPKGSRPPPPPGLDKADMFYNRSTSWAPGEKLKAGLPGQGCMMPSSWLMLKNVSSTLDPGTLQKICLLYGPLQNFYYSKVSGQALACYINREDALSALSNISQNVHSSGPSTRLIAELVAAEDIGRVIDNSWTAIPPSFGGSSSSGAKGNAMRSGWDGM